jgi:hypothetical protein
VVALACCLGVGIAIVDGVSGCRLGDLVGGLVVALRGVMDILDLG